nr:hypothetical protein [Providencia rettgeri]
MGLIIWLHSKHNLIQRLKLLYKKIQLANTALRDGELVLNFEVEDGMFAGNPLGQSIPSIYWYYLVDRLKGEIAPLRYRNGNPDDKLYGCIDEEGTEWLVYIRQQSMHCCK